MFDNPTYPNYRIAKNLLTLFKIFANIVVSGHVTAHVTAHEVAF